MMKTKMMIIMSFLVLVISVGSCTTEKKDPHSTLSAYEQAKEEARFQHSQAVFDSRANVEFRAQELAEKEAVEANRVADDAAFKEGGQVEVKF